MLYLLSHPTERPAVRELVAALREHFTDLTVAWEGQIPAGESWETWDAQTLRESQVVVGILTPDYPERDLFAHRVDRALKRAAAGDCPLVPLLVGDWGGPPPAELAPWRPLAWAPGQPVDALVARVLEARPGLGER